MLEQLGRTVLDADRIAKDVMVSDLTVRRALVRRFGPGTFTRSGELDTRFLSTVVFGDAESLRVLNRTVHPAVLARIQSILSSLPSARSRPYVVVEAALIYETGISERFGQVVVVDSSLETRIRRVVKRSGETRSAVLARMRSQLSHREKVKRASIVIRNNGSLSELRRKVAFLDTLLQSLVRERVTSKAVNGI
jgi:dephospho-CoA kinase